MLESSAFRVEQVFLVHRPTGLLLQHVMAPEVPAKDADQVAAMLTAIRDLVEGSFASTTPQVLMRYNPDEGVQPLGDTWRLAAAPADHPGAVEYTSEGASESACLLHDGLPLATLRRLRPMMRDHRLGQRR